MAWGLIERPPLVGKATRAAGMWTLTDKGRAWAEGRISVPEYCVFESRRVVERYGREVKIRDVLNKEFDITDTEIGGDHG